MLSVIAAALAVAAVAAAISLHRRARRLEEELKGVKSALEEVRSVEGEVRVIRRALGAVLESVEAEELAERLRRKRRRRYIAFQVISEGEPPPPEELEKAIVDAVRRLAGEVGVADARPRLVYYDPRTGEGIVGTTHAGKYLVIAAMGLVRSVAGRRVLIAPIRTAGTIRRARRALARRR